MIFFKGLIYVLCPWQDPGPVYLYWFWMFSKACGSYMLGLQIISAWMHENT